MCSNEALGDSDVLSQRERCCKEIGDTSKGLVQDIGTTFSDGWKDRFESRSGAASFRRGQVIVLVASYYRRAVGGCRML